MAPRGRPKKVLDLTSSAPSSRASSTRRATKLSVAVSIDDSTVSIPATGNTSADELSSLPNAINSKKVMAGRESLSSTSTSIHEDSGYSTPATSAFATPAPQKVEITTSTGRRGRRRVVADVEEDSAIPAGSSVVARATALRNSEYALGGSSSKRKRNVISDDEDDEDNSRDAQLARALQKEEEEAASATFMQEASSFSSRKPRKTQKILPKVDYVDDSDDYAEWSVPPSSAMKPKVELGSSGSNGISFPTKRKLTKYVPETDESDDVYGKDQEIEDSEDDFKDSGDEGEFVPVKAARNKRSVRRQIPPTVSKKGSNSASGVASLSGSSTWPTAALQRRVSDVSAASSALTSLPSANESEVDPDTLDLYASDVSADGFSSNDDDGGDDGDDNGSATQQPSTRPAATRRSRGGNARQRVNLSEEKATSRAQKERKRLELHHPELHTMWQDLENLPEIEKRKIEQPKNITRELKPFQLEGVAWMKSVEKTEWAGGLLGDEMGMGKTIQAVSLIMSDWPAKEPTLVLIPPVALMQWQQEIADYTDGTLKTFVYHGTNARTKGISAKELCKFNVILMSYNSLESMYRKQEKGFKRKIGLHKEKSVIHQIHFHRIILDEAHSIKTRTSGIAKACFALQGSHKWCLSGTPLQNRIGEFFSLLRFLEVRPFACYFCKQCDCSQLNWDMNTNNRCTGCNHSGMQHVSVFNQELLNPIVKFGNNGPGKAAFRKLRILTDRFMLRRVKRDHSAAMELPAKEIYVDRQFFGEEENDFAGSIMNNGTRKFETYVSQGVLLNNYANIFGLIMQMRQVADHPDLILKKNGDGGQNILVCCICDETAEEAIKSSCKHDFCRECARSYLNASEKPDCPVCHIPLAIDLDQAEQEQDEQMVKKSSIINRIKMENWTSSSKIEALVHDLHELRSKNMSTKSIIFSQFTTMLQLVEWRLRRAGITTVMLDGSMTPAQRQASINHFMTDINVECFLVSLKAGGVALNLTEASKVFIVDPWWNPAAEWQSADRCHRIGQARPCSITRLCIEDSVESRMVLLQEKKANMINSTLNNDQSAMESLTPEDMQFLFRGN